MASTKDAKLATSKELREQASHPTLRQRIALVAEIKCRLRATGGQGEIYGQELDEIYSEYGNLLTNAALDELRREDGADSA